MVLSMQGHDYLLDFHHNLWIKLAGFMSLLHVKDTWSNGWEELASVPSVYIFNAQYNGFFNKGQSTLILSFLQRISFVVLTV